MRFWRGLVVVLSLAVALSQASAIRWRRIAHETMDVAHQAIATGRECRDRLQGVAVFADSIDVSRFPGVLSGFEIMKSIGCAYAPTCRRDDRTLSARACPYRLIEAGHPTLPPILFESAPVSIVWSREHKAWIVKPHGGKVLWGPEVNG